MVYFMLQCTKSVLMVVAELVSRVVVSELGSLGRDPTAQDGSVLPLQPWWITLSERLGQHSLKQLHARVCSTGIC